MTVFVLSLWENTSGTLLLLTSLLDLFICSFLCIVYIKVLKKRLDLKNIYIVNQKRVH